MQQFLRHPRMLAAHRTVGDARAGRFGQITRRMRHHRAVDDRKLGLKTPDVGSHRALERAARSKRKADVHHLHRAIYSCRCKVKTGHSMPALQNRGERSTHLAHADNQCDSGFH